MVFVGMYLIDECLFFWCVNCFGYGGFVCWMGVGGDFLYGLVEVGGFVFDLFVDDDLLYDVDDG